MHQPDGEQMSIYDAAMRYQDDGRPAGHLRRPGVRHRQLARLGGEGHAAAGRARGRRAELRAHPPQQPGRHGRPAAASSRRASARNRSARRHRDVRPRRARGRACKPRRRPTLDRSTAPTAQTEEVPLRSCGSTRRSRSTTTSTAASCRTCCASSSDDGDRLSFGGAPSLRVFRPARGPSSRLDDASGGALPSGVPGGPPAGSPSSSSAGTPTSPPRCRCSPSAVSARRRHLLLGHPRPGRRDGRARRVRRRRPRAARAGPRRPRVSRGCAASIPSAEIGFDRGDPPRAPRARSATARPCSASRARRGRSPSYLDRRAEARGLRRRSRR